MSYESNPYKARKGKIGENIIKALLENGGAVVTRPDENEKSLIDFHARPADGSSFVEQLVEVKVRKAFGYAYGQAQGYMFPHVQIKTYMEYAGNNNLPLTLWIIDPDVGAIFAGVLSESGLERTTIIDGREFPVTMDTKNGVCRFYHSKQFNKYPLSKEDKKLFDDLEAEEQRAKEQNQNAQQSLFSFLPVHEEKTTTEPDISPTADVTQNFKKPRKVKTVTSPNGKEITVLEADDFAEPFVKLRELWVAIGYGNSLNDSKLAKGVYEGIKISRRILATTSASGIRIETHIVSANDVTTLLERYIKLTFGAKQSSQKYLRNIAATKLLNIWKDSYEAIGVH